MSESYFQVVDQEWRNGSLAADKLDKIQESFKTIGFAVVAGLYSLPLSRCTPYSPFPSLLF